MATTPEVQLNEVRGSAPEKRPSVRVLSAATAHNDCNFAMLGLAARVNFDKLCDGTAFQAAFGQDPQAFQRGQIFEQRVKENGYAELIRLLRDKAGFPLKDVRTEDLRSRTPPNTDGLRQRANETRRLLRKIARNANDAPNVIDGAVLSCRIAGQVAYYETDSLAAAAGGKLHVVEVKSFPITDGRCESEKLGGACDQAAWYSLLTRLALIEEGLPPDALSELGFIILPEGVGLRPTLLQQDLVARIRRAEKLLAKTPDPREILSLLPAGMRFPDQTLDPQARVDALERMLDRVGTTYRPSCLRDCGMARLCRNRANELGLASVTGGLVVRELPGVPTLSRAAELAGSASPAIGELHVARALKTAAAVFDRATKRGAL
jgi:hypothetical protein